VTGIRQITTGLLVTAALLMGAAPAAALGISVPETATLSALSPGQTSTASGVSILVTGVLFPWSLTVAPESSATPGRLRAGALGCSGSPAALANPLHMNTSAGLGTTEIKEPSYDIVAGTKQIARGIAADALTVDYTQSVAASEALVAGCSYSITLIFTAS